MDAKLACDTLELALNKRKIEGTLLFHSDQGSQFKAREFRKIIDDNNIMSANLGLTPNQKEENYFNAIK
ncbi:hypothetical protein SAG0066_00605 [Streptococcus agalactiae CCUG 38383]|nr:hypothetical protein SAG0066_00605 [Streptococcus agalactiae CCUG 38383]